MVIDDCVNPFAHVEAERHSSWRVDGLIHVDKTPLVARFTALVVPAGQTPLRRNFKVFLPVIQIDVVALGVHVTLVSNFEHDLPRRVVRITWLFVTHKLPPVAAASAWWETEPAPHTSPRAIQILRNRRKPAFLTGGSTPEV